jgi:hypothetical protein
MTATVSPSASPDPLAAGRAYGDSLIANLGDQEPLPVLESLVPRIRKTLAECGDVDLDVPERVGGWSIRDVVEHLADGDIVLAYRTRMILAHDTPPIQGYDQNLWVPRLAGSRGSLDETLEELAMLRRRSVRLFRSLSPAELERAGWHDERGAESLARLMRLYAGHDLRHLAQMKRIAAAQRGPVS